MDNIQRKGMIVTALIFALALGANNVEAERNEMFWKGHAFSDREVEQRQWRQVDYPNPEGDLRQCRSNRICDPDEILNDFELATVEHHLEAMHTIGQDVEDVCMKIALARKLVPLPFLRYKIDLSDFQPFTQPHEKARYGVQSFATFLLSSWFPRGNVACNGAGIILFVSLLDQASSITRSGALTKVLTSGRLEGVEISLERAFRDGSYTHGLLQTIGVLEEFLNMGEPVIQLRGQRLQSDWRIPLWIYGPFLCLGIVACRLRRSRLRQRVYVEARMSQLDREIAETLQSRFQCTECPICWGSFAPVTAKTSGDETQLMTIGSDGLKLKLLRCGHVFDTTCWNQWVKTGSGNTNRCPICKQDLTSSDTLGHLLMTASPRTDREERIERLTTRYPSYFGSDRFRETAPPPNQMSPLVPSEDMTHGQHEDYGSALPSAAEDNSEESISRSL